MSSGITYPPNFLSSLPVISQRKQPYQPIRALDHSQFAQLHARHLLQIGDPSLEETVFPYLHGVEHGSKQMRDYFCSPQPNRTPGQNGLDEREGIGVPKRGSSAIGTESSMYTPSGSMAPHYRGLIWVHCEDNGDVAVDAVDGAMYADDGLDEEMLVEDDELNIRRPSDASAASSSSIDSAYSLLRNSLTSPPSPTPSSTACLTDVDSFPDDITMTDNEGFHTPPPKPDPVVIPCSFRPQEILSFSEGELIPPKVPENVSIRNFGIQVAAYVRISDIVVYSPTYRGLTGSLVDLAEKLSAAVEKLYDQRSAASSSQSPMQYNVFILTSHPAQLPSHILSPVPHFSRLETQEIHTLTQSSEVLPGIYLGNSNDVPIWSSHEAGVNVFDNSNNPYGYDLVVECVEGGLTPVPTPSHLKRAEDHVNALQSLWATGFMLSVPPARPAPNAHSILHLPFPGSPSPQTPFAHITSFVSFMQGLMHPQHSSRRAKVLIYCQDGYTETSVLGLSLIMAEKKCSLPEAYIELQTRRGRSFFVHQGDLALLKKIEAKYNGSSFGSLGRSSLGKSKERGERDKSGWHFGGFGKGNHNPDTSPTSSGPSLSLKFGKRSNSQSSSNPPDHSGWFNHPKFDGSFPSRVLPFLYLGNLNHAVNAHMLHALGITHVVSVGECAILPPEEVQSLSLGNRPLGSGSLWLEEREGRIKVLDIKNMCDDGMDSLLPQLNSICGWIERARQEGGKILVHCRVGVSRSATVTIAYIMKYLEMPLVDSYLIVRSRRLSVLIQPNMRLLFNLLAWEVLITRERLSTPTSTTPPPPPPPKSTDTSLVSLVTPRDETIAEQLSKALSWPFLAREIYRLNAKYIR